MKKISALFLSLLVFAVSVPASFANGPGGELVSPHLMNSELTSYENYKFCKGLNLTKLEDRIEDLEYELENLNSNISFMEMILNGDTSRLSEQEIADVFQSFLECLSERVKLENSLSNSRDRLEELQNQC